MTDKTKKNDVSYLKETLIDIEINNLIECKDSIDDEMVERLARDILAAPEVVVIGSRASCVLVDYATYIFNKVGIKASGFDAADTKSLDSINNIDSSALILSFGFYRYPKSTIVLSRFLKHKGYKIIAVTDDKKISPLNDLSEYSFKLKASSYEFTDSYASAILLLNLVVALIGKFSMEDTAKRLKDFDETAQQLNFYL